MVRPSARVAPPAGRRAALGQGLDELASAAGTGGASALRTFLAAIEPTVRRVCRGVLGRDSPDLEDAIQDSLIDVYRGLSRFRFESSVSYYVVRIALRRAIACRRRVRRAWMERDQTDVLGVSRAVLENRTLEARVELLRKFLDQLNNDQTTALLLRIMMGHSVEEVADMTGVSVNTVKTRLRLGKGQLRRWFEQSGERRRAAPADRAPGAGNR